MNLRETLQKATLVAELRPVDAQLAVALSQSLFAAGIRVFEISLRAPAGLASIEAVRAALPQAVVGASGLGRALDFAAAGRLNVNYGSSPGFTPEIAAAARGARFPLLPGVMSPSDVIAARAAGFNEMKIFPAPAAGGTKFVQVLAEDFPEVAFAIAGLVDAADASDYLRLPHVLCVGAPWLAPSSLVSGSRWTEIESLARAALAEAAQRRGERA